MIGRITALSLGLFFVASIASSTSASARIIGTVVCKQAAKGGIHGKYTIWCANPSGRDCNFSLEVAHALCEEHGGLEGRYWYDSEEHFLSLDQTAQMLGRNSLEECLKAPGCSKVSIQIPADLGLTTSTPVLSTLKRDTPVSTSLIRKIQPR